MDPRPINYLRQNIVFSSPEKIRVSFSLFLSLSVFLLFYVIINFYKNYFIIIIILFIYFHENYFYFFMFRDVTECFGMFRHVPECFMFRILSTPFLGNSCTYCQRAIPAKTLGWRGGSRIEPRKTGQ